MKRISRVILFALIFSGLTACDSRQRGEKQTPATSDAEKTKAAPSKDETGEPASKEVTAEEARTAPEAADLAKFTEGIPGEGSLYAKIHTPKGVIECRLHEDRVPRTVANFVGLARGKKAWIHPETGEPVVGQPFYDSVIFHRVIPNFMIQTGDPTGTGTGGPGYTFPDEFDQDLRHDRPGVLSMANSGPDTNASQFFITEAPAPHLNFRHTVFGSCESLDVVKAIARVPAGPRDRPDDPPVIEKIEFERRPTGDTESP